jgi:hypothetical protein
MGAMTQRHRRMFAFLTLIQSFDRSLRFETARLSKCSAMALSASGIHIIRSDQNQYRIRPDKTRAGTAS